MRASCMYWRAAMAAGQRDRHAAKTAVTTAAQTAGDAAQFAHSGSVAATHRRRQEGGRASVRLREDSVTVAAGVSEPPYFFLPHRKGQAGKSAATRWALLLAQQSDRGRPSRVVDALRATDPDRGGVPLVENRLGNSSDLPSVGAPGGRPHPDCLLGLLSTSHTEEPPADSRAGSDTNGRIGKIGHHPDDRRMDSNARWPLVDLAALHATSQRSAASAGANPTASALPAAAPNHRSHTPVSAQSSRSPTLSVVKTFR